jgi:hypothetical protein
VVAEVEIYAGELLFGHRWEGGVWLVETWEVAESCERLGFVRY